MVGFWLDVGCRFLFCDFVVWGCYRTMGKCWGNYILCLEVFNTGFL